MSHDWPLPSPDTAGTHIARRTLLTDLLCLCTWLAPASLVSRYRRVPKFPPYGKKHMHALNGLACGCARPSRARFGHRSMIVRFCPKGPKLRYTTPSRCQFIFSGTLCRSAWRCRCGTRLICSSQYCSSRCSMLWMYAIRSWKLTGFNSTEICQGSL